MDLFCVLLSVAKDELQEIAHQQPWMHSIIPDESGMSFQSAADWGQHTCARLPPPQGGFLLGEAESIT